MAAPKRGSSHLCELSPFYFQVVQKETHMQTFLLDNSGDMVERGLIMAAIVVAAIALWVSIGQKLAGKLGIVESSF
jgi:Flp pilus assembly pilin Flp